MITLEMIHNGYNKGIVQILDAKDYTIDDCPICKIGDYWFYFAGSEGDGMSAREYVEAVGIDDVCNEIFIPLLSFMEVDEFVDEYKYYEAVLIEGGCV